MGLYTPLIAVALMLAAFCLRRFTTPWAWVHTAAGAFAVAAVTGVLDAVAEAIRTGGLHAESIVPAVVTFFMSLMAMANPSMKGDEKPKMILPGEISKFAFLPILFAGAMLVSGCATTRAVVTDVAAQCGVKVVGAITQTEDVLATATSADAALADIAKIVGAAASDAAAVYCVISEAVKSMKAHRAQSGGTAPTASQLRVMTADGLSLPFDPNAHGIALGEDLLREQARMLVVSTVGAP